MAQQITENTSQEEIPAQYVVHLPVFEGPLDLLLYLIEKRQMEITTVSLVTVTDQYLAYLQQYNSIGLLPQPPPYKKCETTGNPLEPLAGAAVPTTPLHTQALLANMAAFVSIAARLLYIKSQNLLPHASQENLTSDMEQAATMAEELQQHLLEYKLAKEIASQLHHRGEAGLQTYGRSSSLAGIEAQLAWTPPSLVGLEAQSLAKAFQRLLTLQIQDQEQYTDFIPIARVRISERIIAITHLLQARSQITFAEIITNEHSRIVIIVTFLAVLEMWKQEQISVKQETSLGPIILKRGLMIER